MIQRYYFSVEVFKQYNKFKVVGGKDRENATREFATIQDAIHFAHSLISREEIKHAHDPIGGF